MEDDFNLKSNERKPDVFGKWEMTSILYYIEEDFNFS
jgi:hypothetical protein